MKILIISSVCLFAAHAGQRTRTVSVRMALCLAILLTCHQMAFSANRTKIVTLDFPSEEYSFDKHGDLTYIGAPRQTYIYGTDTTMPMLPVITVRVLIAANEQVSDIAFSFSNPITQSAIQLEACSQPVTEGDEFMPVSQPATATISPTASFMRCENIRGYRIAYFDILPFAYDVASHQLTIFESLDIKMKLTSQGGLAAPVSSRDQLRCDTATMWLKDLVCNAEEMSSLYAQTHIDAIPANERYEYLIITNNALKHQFQPLAEWKNTKGIRTKILTTEEIYQTYPGTTPQNKIKAAINDVREATGEALRYVLLGGDETVVPAQIVSLRPYKEYPMFKQANSEDTPCDLFYACFDPTNMFWDKNGNGILAEIEDSVSLSPQLSVSRMPAYNDSTAMAQVNKVLAYEKHPDLKTWRDEILLAGVKMNYYKYNTIWGDTVSDAHERSEVMYRDYIQPHWNGTRTRLYDTGTDFPGNADYDLTAVHLQSELEKGYPLVHVETHGSYWAWRMERGETFYYHSFARKQKNNGYSVVLTSACNTLEFEKDEYSLAEHLICNPYSGVVAYMGTSKESWLPNSNYYFDRPIFRNLLKDRNHRLADAITSLRNSLSMPNKHSYNRWITLALNMFGDPEMPVQLQKPHNMPGIRFQYADGTLSVKTGVDSCRVCVMSMNDTGDTYYNVQYSVNNTESTFTGLTDSSLYSVCISKPGYVPFVARVCKQYYLQNEEIAAGEQLYVIAERAALGSHVTDAKSQGEAIVSGKLTIQSPSNVLVDKGTTIKPGAQFEIKLNH